MVAGKKVGEKIEALLREGNIRRVVVKQEGRTIAEFPVTIGVLGAAIAAIAKGTHRAVCASGAGLRGAGDQRVRGRAARSYSLAGRADAGCIVSRRRTGEGDDRTRANSGNV